MISVIIPAYNEESGIKSTLVELADYLDAEYEVIVVNDGSSDNTGAVVEGLMDEYPWIHCITHRRNCGYGSAIVTGCKHSHGDIIVWYDADGQHRPEDLISLVKKMQTEDLDYCVGIRGGDSHVDRSRKHGKVVLKWIVNMLAKEKMNDFNSGLRGFKKEILMNYLSLLPKRFGASTVTSFIMQEMNCIGGEVPIVVRKRVGTSTVKPIRDGIRTLSLILNIILLFRPKEIFGVSGMIFILVGVIYGIFCAITEGLGIPVLSAIICIFGIQLFFFGAISSQISQLRLEKYHREG